MKSVTPELQALLAGGKFATANLYTLTLADSTPDNPADNSILRLTSMADYSVVWDGNAYSHDSLTIERGSIKQAVGIEVDNVEITLMLGTDETLQGLPIPHFVRNGGFNGARLLIQRAYFAIDSGGNVNANAVGVIFSFDGRVTEPQSGRTQVTFKVASDTELLSKMVPANVITKSCMNRLYDGRCGVNKATYSHPSSVTTATKTTINCALAQADDYFSLGTVLFTSGQNAGAMRTVKKYTTGHFVLLRAFDYAPQAGDEFTAVAGCDLAETTCNNRFNKLPNRRYFPFVPVYEENL